MTKVQIGWTAFSLACLLAFAFGEFGYPYSVYWTVLSVLAVLALALGVAVVVNSQRRWSSMGFVLLGLLIGQWRLLSFLVVPLLWRAGGFAP